MEVVTGSGSGLLFGLGGATSSWHMTRPKKTIRLSILEEKSKLTLSFGKTIRKTIRFWISEEKSKLTLSYGKLGFDSKQ